MSTGLETFRPSDFAALRAATKTMRKSAQDQRWYSDPAAWVHERIKEDTWSGQASIMRAVGEHPLVAVRSGHGIGKSHLASRLVGWFLDTRPAGQAFVVTTAPTNDQVRAILWRYISQMWTVHDLPGRVTQDAQWKFGNELVAYGRKPSDYNESAFQGIHAKHLLVILDEACGIPEQLWVAADALATSVDSHILAIGNPDTTSSHFHQVHTTEEGWHRIRVSSLDTPNFTGEDVSQHLKDTLVQVSWVEDKRKRWGEDSPLYRAKVLGEFADDKDGLIPLSWVTEAQHRWLDWDERPNREVEPLGRVILGVDVGGGSDDDQVADLTAIATRQGHVVKKLETWRNSDTMNTAFLVEARLTDNVKAVAIVDSIGVGTGVLHRLRQRRQNVRPFVAGAATARADQTNTLHFNNLRSAAWWNMRELLDPSQPGGSTICLPPDDDLAADLTTPRWKMLAGNKIAVEPKDEIRKRLKRSTDRGDAVIQAFWTDPSTMRDPEPERPKLKARSYANARSNSFGRAPTARRTRYR